MFKLEMKALKFYSYIILASATLLNNNNAATEALLNTQGSETTEGISNNSCLVGMQGILGRTSRCTVRVITELRPLVEAGVVVGLVPQALGNTAIYLIKPLATFIENMANYCCPQNQGE